MEVLRLKEVLKQKGVTGKELATKTGVSQPAISDITNGKSFPRPELLLKIATALDVDLKELFISTKKGQKIQVIISNELRVFNSVEEFKEFAEGL